MHINLNQVSSMLYKLCLFVNNYNSTNRCTILHNDDYIIHSTSSYMYASVMHTYGISSALHSNTNQREECINGQDIKICLRQ